MAIRDRLSQHRLYCFVGAYGSGKSEVSVNVALWLNRHRPPVTLCDLDVINPFFRSADARALLTSQGIDVVAPLFAGTNVDVPAVPAQVLSVFDDSSRRAILDLGGEDLGARVLGSFAGHFERLTHAPAIWMVVNPFRPHTASVAQVVAQARALEAASGQAITGLVHNANLLQAGDASLLSQTDPLLRQAADKLGLPLVFAAAMADQVPAHWTDQTPEGLPLLRMQPTIRYEEGP